jgi:FO synthase
VLAVARAACQAGSKEALFSLGDKPELRYLAYREWLNERPQFHHRIFLGHVPSRC